VNNVISAIAFLAALIAWTPTYAGQCPGTRILARGGSHWGGYLGALEWIILIEIPNGGPSGKFYEITPTRPVGVRTGVVIVDCVRNADNTLSLTIRDQHGSMVYAGRPDPNECNYRLALTANPTVPGWDAFGPYTCDHYTSGEGHNIAGRLD
jgi:hypothetical protein